MVTTPKNAEIKTAFVHQHAEPLKGWGQSLAERSGPVIAISRKAPRLLELGVREGVLPRSLLLRVTTERGLAVDASQLSAAESPTVCDDIIIVGSTFHRVAEVTGETYGDKRVVGLPFALSRQAKKDNLKTVKEPAILLDEENCTSFVNGEISAFGLLDKPYDIEHPILYLDLTDEATASAIARSLKSAALLMGGQFYATPRRLTRLDTGIDERQAWTILFPEVNATQASQFFAKIRCYYDRENQRLLVVPIAPRTGTLQELHEAVSAILGAPSECWAQVRSRIPADRASSNALKLVRQRSLVAWSNYLIELADLGASISDLREILASDGMVEDGAKFDLDNFDVQLLTGPCLSHQITTQLCAYVNVDAFRRCVPRSFQRLVKLRPDIPSEYEKSYQQALQDLLEGCEATRDILDSAFKAQHVGIELESRNASPPDPDRLEFGVPFSYLCQLIQDKPGRADIVEVHMALDTMIDWGVIVPRYLSQNVEDQQVWFRSFRIGERQAEVRAHVVRECLQALSSVLDRSDLTEVLTEKFLVLACDHIRIFNDPGLASEPGITRGFHLYGARPQVRAGAQVYWLVEWAQRRRLLARKKVGQEWFYQLDERAAPYFKENERSLSPRIRNDVGQLANWIKEAIGNNELGSDFLVTITTVESPWAYSEALRAELTGWVHHAATGYSAALNALDDLARENTPQVLARTDYTLGEVANWHAQAQKKYLLRSRLDHYMKVADVSWPANTYQPNAMFWRNLLRPMLEQRRMRAPRPINVVETTLQPALSVVGRLMSLLRNIVSKFTGIHADKAIPIADATKALIEAINNLPIHMRDPFLEAVKGTEEVAKALDFASATGAVREPVEVIAGAVDWAVNLYADFSDEALDTLEPGYYVLFWDVRGSSTGNPTREPLTRRIMEVNQALHRAFGKRLTEFDQHSTDDGVVAICKGFENAIAIAQFVVNGLAPEYTAKMGCDANVDGSLHRGRSSRRLSGRAFEYAARMMGFFGEIGKDPNVWIPDNVKIDEGDGHAPKEPATGTSYLVLSEQAFRLAQEEVSDEKLNAFNELLGRYRPRVYGAIRRRVFFCELPPPAVV